MAGDWAPGELLIWGSGAEREGRADTEAPERVLGGPREGGTQRGGPETWEELKSDLRGGLRIQILKGAWGNNWREASQVLYMVPVGAGCVGHDTESDDGYGSSLREMV